MISMVDKYQFWLTITVLFFCKHKFVCIVIFYSSFSLFHLLFYTILIDFLSSLRFLSSFIWYISSVYPTCPVFTPLPPPYFTHYWELSSICIILLYILFSSLLVHNGSCWKYFYFVVFIFITKSSVRHIPKTTQIKMLCSGTFHIPVT